MSAKIITKRTRKIKPKYECTRCGYVTSQKPDIRKHLYELKMKCPAIENDIELTDDIKSYILENRIYKIPKEKKEKTMNQIITNNYQINNTMNNILKEINIEELFDRYKKFNEIKVTGLEFDINDKYTPKIKRLENDKYKFGIHFNQSDLLEIVDDISKASDSFDDLNVLYDNDINKIKLYSRNWKNYLVDNGVNKLIETIQDSYLYAYEMYLIRKIYNGKIINYQEINKYKLSLEEYYKFINMFNVQPYCTDKTNDDILDNGQTDSYEIQDKIYKIYNNIKTSKSEINKLKKTVLDIIKNNSKTIIKDLNKKVIDLLKMNEEFKNDLLNSLGLINENENETISIENTV